MTKRARFIWCCRWTGLIMSLLVLIGFFYSTKRGVHWNDKDVNIEIGLLPGAVCYGRRPAGYDVNNDQYRYMPGWSIASYAVAWPQMYWLPKIEKSKWWVGTSIPLWIPFVLLSVPTSILWYRDRRAVVISYRRLRAWFCPAQPKKVTWALVVSMCVIHFFINMMLVNACHFMIEFYFTTNSSTWKIREPYYDILIDWLAPCLMLGTPLFGYLWARLYVRLKNRVFVKLQTNHCQNCGYNLTGNVTGICSECGKEIIAKD